MVTPDPGVIEVNLQPTASWPALRELTTTLYDTAREVRLGTEKFDLDGLHTGTGGGNHLTLGGPTPERSPILRRPDLLVSMLTFWQHHPSLSYLFSGRFVGPDQPGAARRRGPRGEPLRARDRLRRDRAAGSRGRGRGRRLPAVGRRPRAAPPAHRPDRQHPPRRVLHRQALQPRHLARPARAAGAARLRDAAARPDGAAPGRAGPRAGGALRRRALPQAAGPLGHRAARALPAALGLRRRHRRGVRRPARPRHRDGGGVVRALRGVPLPPHRYDERGRRRARAAPGRRAVEGAGGGAGRRRGHRPLRRLLRRAGAGPGHRRRARPPPRDLQRRTRPAGADRHHRPARRLGPLPGLAAALRAAPQHRGPLPAPLRRDRPRRRSALWEDAPTTSCTPGAGPTT